MPRKQYLEEKFGGPARAAEIYARVHAAGVAVGLDLNFGAIKQQANTLAAHALIAFAQEADVTQSHAKRPTMGTSFGNEVKERLMKAYFVEGRFVGSIDVLAQIAMEAGLDGDRARAYVTDPRHLAGIAQEDAQARQMGVTGVPFFIFNQKVAVSGAQDPQTLLADGGGKSRACRSKYHTARRRTTGSRYPIQSFLPS